MQRNIFSPKVQGQDDDTLSTFFYKTSQIVMVTVFGLLPLFFVPNVYVSLGLMKSFFVIIGIFATIIFAALAILRSGRVKVILPLPLIIFWVFAFSAIASSLLSGDVTDSLFGTSFDTQTSGFFVLLASIITACLVFVHEKTAFTRLVWLSILSLVVVYCFTLIRLVTGPDFLSFGFFNSNLTSLVGSLNDLALYVSLILLFVLLVINKIPDNIFVKPLLGILTFGSLLILAIVNFSFIWVALGFFSLLTFLYLVSRDTWLKVEEEEIGAQPSLPVSRFTLFLVAVITMTSGAFIVSGDFLGAKLSQVTGVSYVEVRPSLTATLGVARDVYQTDALFGIGPNRFEDAWRLHKDPVLNETQFWNTQFVSGNSFVSTLMVNTGLAGLILFLAFIISFVYTAGYKLFFAKQVVDIGWQLVGNLTFVGACYLWIMSFLYSPGPFILLLTALLTGLSIAAGVTLTPESKRVLNLAHSRHQGLIIMASVLITIVASTVLFISANKQFISQVLFFNGVNAFAINQDVPAYDRVLERVSNFNEANDGYVAERARLRLAELNRLLGMTSPSEDDQRRFEATLVEGVTLAESAIAKDATNPYNYGLLGSFYGFINPSLYEGVLEKRENAFNQARKLDPVNPEYLVLQAQLVARLGELDKARLFLTEAVQLKRNYTDALFLLSQLDVQEGNATSAIATTKSIITLEPRNPGRYFQLGLLLVATGDLPGAITPLESAIILDPNYANARYVLALTYLDLGRAEEALVQLKMVEATNPDNAELKSLITQLEAGSYSSKLDEATVPELKDGVVQNLQDGVLTTAATDTNLVTPINTLPKGEEDSVTNESEEDSDPTSPTE
jgi:tetratricopeptide (TPR) repeat protein